MNNHARLLADIHAALVELQLERNLVKKAETSLLLDQATVRLVQAEDRMFGLLNQLDRNGGFGALADLARHAERGAV